MKTFNTITITTQDAMRRRKFLGTMVGCTGFALGSGVMSARAEEDDPISITEAEIKDEFSSKLKKAKFEEAEEMAEEHNIEFHHTKSEQEIEIDPLPFEDDEMTIEPQAGAIDKQDVTAHCTLTKLNDEDRYLATGALEHPDEYASGTAWGNPHWAPDVCGISYNSSVWASPEPTEDNVTLWKSGKYINEIEYDKYKPEEGLACKLDVAAKPRWEDWDEDFVVTVQTEIEQIQQEEDIPVTFVYRHTAANSPTGSIKSINIGNVLGLSLSLSSFEVWDSPAKATEDTS